MIERFLLVFLLQDIGVVFDFIELGVRLAVGMVERVILTPDLH